MDDLISRKALLSAYDNAHEGPPGNARRLIEEAPAVISDYEDADMDIPFAVFALLRATKKKPKNKHRWIYSSQIYVGDCPNCGEVVGIGDNFCHKCGQALDWSGT